MISLDMSVKQHWWKSALAQYHFSLEDRTADRCMRLARSHSVAPRKQGLVAASFSYRWNRGSQSKSRTMHVRKSWQQPKCKVYMAGLLCIASSTFSFCVPSVLLSHPFRCRTPPTYSTITTMASPDETTTEGCSCCTVSGSTHSIRPDPTLTPRYRAAATTPTARRTLALPKLTVAVRARLEENFFGELISKPRIGESN